MMKAKTHTRSAAACSVERAQQLVDARPQGGYTLEWVAQAAHVGDVVVLALALLK
jgi:hypothetical protein